MRRVLFIDEIHPCLQEQLEEMGWTCESGIDKSQEEILQILDQYQGLVIRSRFKLTSEIISKATQLQFIARPGAGLENIDTEFAQQQGIHVFNSPEGNRDAVGEQAMGMLLMLLNNLKRADAEVRQGKWLREANRGHEIMGKTVGIIGYGNMGSTFAKKLRGFDCRVIAYDKYKTGFSQPGIEEVTLAELFATTDILSIHVHLTDETRHLVDAHFLDQFTKPIYFINTARGAVVKTTDLVDQLEQGKVIGACLDVLEYESTSFEALSKEGLPEAFQYLVQSDRVVLAPHIAGWTHESNRKMAAYLADKIRAQFGPN